MPHDGLLIELPCSLEAPGEIRRRLSEKLTGSGLDRRQRDRLLLAVSEICVNIARHGEPKAKTLWVECAFEPDVVIRITDNGGAFTNADNAFSAAEGMEFDGQLGESGIGLALITQSGAQLAYTAGAPGDRPNCHQLILPLDPVGRRLPVLHCIEDDPIYQELIKTYLRGHYDVATFSNAEDYLAVASVEQPDIVISDISLPGIDGLEMRKSLQQREELDIVPFLFLTGSTDPELRRRASPLGIDDFLEKPVSKETLLAVLERVRRRSNQLRDRLSQRVDRHIIQLMRTELPRTLTGIALHLECRPGGIGGGDLVRHYRLDGWDLIVLADLTGHDETSSYLAQGLAGLMGGVARFGKPASPGAFLAAVAEGVLSDPAFAATHGSAVAIGVNWDGTVRVAGAGHPPVAVVTEDQVTLIPSDGAMLGLPPGRPPEETTVSLSGDDRLYVFSDGLAESTVEIQSLFDGLDRMAGLDTLLAKRGSVPSDDITLLTLAPTTASD